MKVTLGHTGIVVQDFARMRDFYRRVIGLDEQRHVVREGPFISGLVGLTNVRLEVVILGTAERPSAIELLKYHRHPSAVVPKGPNGHGVNHVQFIVDDMDAAVARLQGEGLEFWGPVQPWPDSWRRCLYAKDPEGNVIEFNEPLPGAPAPDAPHVAT